ncbi:hypothetical protein IX329_001012 [Fusobacterium necrophorum]|nr:hypothetical protein [Fusobacterium necrophorum]MBR8733438.1 hypothetical protein [Fusobacterium necrophorum]MBR8789615.1 hypothetical protein [Fusobacterium necrophorum]MCF0163444.1 hypothetical protein [Fusobacterium necrophorum]
MIRIFNLSIFSKKETSFQKIFFQMEEIYQKMLNLKDSIKELENIQKNRKEILEVLEQKIFQRQKEFSILENKMKILLDLEKRNSQLKIEYKYLQEKIQKGEEKLKIQKGTEAQIKLNIKYLKEEMKKLEEISNFNEEEREL